jgi:DnaK suppressor protein
MTWLVLGLDALPRLLTWRFPLPEGTEPTRGTSKVFAMDESAIRHVLNAERATTLARIQAMQADLDAIVAASANANADDEHDPEGSTIAYERAQVAALLAGAQSNLGDLDSALARLSAGEYSICERCHSQISAERLAALPAVRTCFVCANNSVT